MENMEQTINMGTMKRTAEMPSGQDMLKSNRFQDAGKIKVKISGKMDTHQRYVRVPQALFPLTSLPSDSSDTSQTSLPSGSSNASQISQTSQASRTPQSENT